MQSLSSAPFGGRRNIMSEDHKKQEQRGSEVSKDTKNQNVPLAIQGVEYPTPYFLETKGVVVPH